MTQGQSLEVPLRGENPLYEPSAAPVDMSQGLSPGHGYFGHCRSALGIGSPCGSCVG
jgi:hypothetical protein